MDNSGNVIRIPKRPRGFVGRNKFGNNHVSSSPGSNSIKATGSVAQATKLDAGCKKMVGEQVAKSMGPAGGKTNSGNQIAKLDGGVTERIVSPKVKEKLRVDDLKKSRSGRGTSGWLAEVEEEVHLVVNNGDALSSRKRRSNHRKRKDMASASESLPDKVEPPADSSTKMFYYSHDEDEENLEQNAARMLSSRFDPSCTQFSSKSRSPSTNDLSSLISSDEDFISRGTNISAGLELTSGESASRVLRPRKRHKGDGLLRKRRHFYEIFSRDLDAYWVLNRRIKVFWPLDESWYYGLVSDYSPETKLHHIKYDDRDEEWINLQNERFKLLLLPSEVPHKTEPKGVAVGIKNSDSEEKDLPSDDSLISYMDSEPIISWLVRSSRRVKSSPLGSSKRHKTSHLSPKLLLKLSTKTDSTTECLEKSGSSERDTSKLYCNSALPDRSSDHRRVNSSLSGGSSVFRDNNSPVVYVRRRFRKKGRGFINVPVDKNACGSMPLPFYPSVKNDISLGHTESEGLLWLDDDSGLLKMTIPFVESKRFSFKLGFPVSALSYTFEAEYSWLLRALFLLEYGTVMTMWPKVHLEILFVDNIVGLRFLLFEGSLKQAVDFVLLVLAVFYQPDQQGKAVDMQTPVTSIRFKLSCVEDFRKRHVFAFYSFSEVKCSKWLYLNFKLQQHCLLAKQLPLSECTYDNIKALASHRNQLPMSASSRVSSANEDSWKDSVHGIMPIGGSVDSCYGAMDHSSSKYDAKHGKLLPFALSFTAAPSFFLSLHLKLLMENNVASISLRKDDSMCSLEHFEETCHPIARGCNMIQEFSEKISKTTPVGDPRNSLMEVESPEWSRHSKQQWGVETTSECSDGGQLKFFDKFPSGKCDVAKTSASSEDSDKNAGDGILQSQEGGHMSPELKQVVTSSQFLVPKDDAAAEVSDVRSCSTMTGLSVEVPLLQLDERPVLDFTPIATQSSDVAWNMSVNVVRSPNTTGSRSMWPRSRSSLNSSFSHIRPSGKPEFFSNGFGNGPKKPRTQVQYTLPVVGFDSSSKHKTHKHRGLPFHRIRKANDKRASEVSRNSCRNLEFLACDANVLITISEKGWRECGARVELELADHNEWRLAVKISGSTKFSYKAHQFLQPGSTNRYTHAMMWRGGKDWVLEFPDRTQWMLFKEMHEECYNRNIRAASVKNIPIPGVLLVEESDDNGTEVPFVRSSPKYFQQVETDAEMAMDPLHVLYDMDSDDEKWISGYKESYIHGRKCDEVSEELFEKTMDMFEKVAHAQQRDNFTFDEVEEFMAEVGPMELVKNIFEHWQMKRLRKGMPLIRHLQPPLWERYQQQVKEWEQTVAKANSTLSSGCHEKAPPLEKPPMFAFCLKPRGLETPNKGSKQRSQRRFPVPGHSYSLLGDQDGLYAFGRRSNGYAFGEEKVMFLGNSHEYSDTSPLFQPSTRVFSPRDANSSGHFSMSNDWSEWNHRSKLHRNKSKKIGNFHLSNSSKVLASHNQRTIGKRNGANRWNMMLPEWPNQKHGFEQLDGSELDEFRLRDASGAALHALNMARLKREKAQKLLYRADLATHKAVVALMTAEVIKASSEDSDGDDELKDEMRLRT